MKYIFTCIVLLSIISSVLGQDSPGWIIYHNNKKILTRQDTHFENDKKYLLKITKAALKVKGSFIIKYNTKMPTTAASGWTRSITVTDNNETLLYKKDSTSRLEISNIQLKKLFSGTKELSIDTWLYPPPGIMAPIRRFHLCTLRLQ